MQLGATAELVGQLFTGYANAGRLDRVWASIADGYYQGQTMAHLALAAESAKGHLYTEAQYATELMQFANPTA